MPKKNKKNRILFLADSLRPGGRERRLVELLRVLNQIGDLSLFLILTDDNIHYKEILSIDVKIYFVKRNQLFFKQYYKYYK